MTLIDVQDLYRLYRECRGLTDKYYIEFLVESVIKLAVIKGERLPDTLSTTHAQVDYLRSTEVWVSDTLVDVLRKDVFQTHFTWLKHQMPKDVIQYLFNRQQQTVLVYQEGDI